ncbi:MAG TPA: hypothetical protein VH062_22555 [Polyangiaceae bacterium]|nr:hypothetical protein [Polyangiaceae bacterium]
MDAVIARLATLPAEEQDRIAGWLEAELVSEEGWARRFAISQDALSAPADEALADEVSGRTAEIDPDRM